MRNLIDLVEAFAVKETAPDVLFLGDSVHMCTSSQDVYTESLANMLVRKGDANTRRRVYACGAFHGTMFSEILARVLGKAHRPKAVVLPVNIRSFSPQWFHHPAYQFEPVRSALQEYDAQGDIREDFEIRYPQNVEYTAYDRMEHSFFDHGRCRLGEFRRVLETKPTSEAEASHRRRMIFTFFYMNHLEPDHPLLHVWKALAQRLIGREIHLFAYLTPINRDCGQKYVGPEFSRHVAENAAKVRQVFETLGESPFLHYADWCLDFGQDLFVYDENPDEHLNYQGREILTDRIHAWLQNAGAAPIAPAAELSLASESEEGGNADREPEVAPREEAEAPRAAVPHPEVLQEWLDLNSVRCNRLYYRDQSAQTLSSLAKLAHDLDPSVVVELGTLAGLSLRAWVAATTRARIFAVDLSFKTLRETMHFLPLDLSRVTLLEQDILKTDFSTMWGPDDRVVFFVDAHDLPGVPIMKYVLGKALQSLPEGSLVVVDDLWFCEERLTPGNARAFLEDHVVPQIDELQCFTGHYAPYHRGGSFMGFAEVVPLLKFVNRHGIELVPEKGSKHVSFAWRREYASAACGPAEEDTAEWTSCTGSVTYNPLACVPADPSLHGRMQRIAAGYQQGRVREVAQELASLATRYPKDQGLSFGLAVCLARGGLLEEARTVLDRGDLGTSHPRYRRLLADLTRHLESTSVSRTEPSSKPLDGQAMTIFAMPKPFAGHVGTIQRNAIRSWARLEPKPEILLFGDEPGIVEMAREVGVRHVPEVERNEFGTPRVDRLFEAAQNHASGGLVAYVNADMILFQDFVEAAHRASARFPCFLLIGQRWDLPVLEEIDFEHPRWRRLLQEQMEEHSILHAECGLDYFVFSKGLYTQIPPLAIGRTAWDNWLVLDPLKRGVPVIDGTDGITAVHQDHDYAHVAGGRREAWAGKEAERNRALVGPTAILGRTSTAPWVLGRDGALKQVPPRETSYVSDAYRQARSDWLIEQAQRLAAAGREELAVCKCEEARDLLEIWLASKAGQGKPGDSADPARVAEAYQAGFVSLAQLYVHMRRPKQAVATYTRLLENPRVELPRAQWDRIARVRDQLVLQVREDEAARPSALEVAPATPARVGELAGSTVETRETAAESLGEVLDEMERKFRSMPDDTRAKQVLAVRIAEIAQRLGLSERSRAWRAEASVLREGRERRDAARHVRIGSHPGAGPTQRPFSSTVQTT